MFAYEWDPTTGGYLLNSTQLKFSKEPRPVYYKELDILGFNKFWSYEKQDELPYMWAEASTYIYRGRVIAKTIGGSLYSPPTLEVYEKDLELKPVDIGAMVEKSTDIMTALVNESIQKIYTNYLEYKNKIDVFYVAFSGGKDSVALLDVVQKALPHDEFVVVFGDTDMECDDTYKLRNEIEKFPGYEDIKFYTAKSHLKALDTWNIFGPPAQIMRWCCSVHKTAPQVLLLKEMYDKPDFKGMAFVGVRKDESFMRSQYETISESEKHEGQLSCNAIDFWNSAELFLYTYQNRLLINKSYLTGNSRVGCLVCPMSSGKHEYIKYVTSKEKTDLFVDAIIRNSSKGFIDNNKWEEFLNVGGWKARRNGRELNSRDVKYAEIVMNNTLLITITDRSSDWKEWIKTIGVLLESNKDNWLISYNNQQYSFNLKERNNQLFVELDIQLSTKIDNKFVSIFKNVFRKTAYCIGCRVCEANCPYGCLKISQGVHISDDCNRCQKCHNVDYGCLVYNSQRLPKGDNNMDKNKVKNRYLSFGVEKQWIEKYILLLDDFWSSESNDIGNEPIQRALRAFLLDSDLRYEPKKNKKEAVDATIRAFIKLGTNSHEAWSILLANLSYSPQFNWYIRNIPINKECNKKYIEMLLSNDIDGKSPEYMVSAFKNIFISTPLGNGIGLGICNYTEKNGRTYLNSITRSSWKSPNALVILYSLYKFAEACDDYYQFTLSRLLNHDIDSEGVSPSQIFGLERETMEGLLNGLSMKHPEFISAGFTHDLDNITLSADKTSMDVLNLF